MLIIDDILLFPGSSILWVFRQLHQAAQEEIAGEAESITSELRELYMMLETGTISSEQYEAQEKALLDRLADVRHEEE